MKNGLFEKKKCFFALFDNLVCVTILLQTFLQMRETLQKQFLDVLVRKFSKKAEAVEEISETLSISRDGAYRRLRGGSVLTPEEMQVLAIKHRISIDELIFKKTDKVFFTFNSFTQPVKKFEDYLNGLNQNLDAGMKLPNAKVLYTTAEIPMFYYGVFPELMCFKMYVWGKTVWNFEYLQDQKFSFDLFSPTVMKLITEVSDKYLRIKSTELWCRNVFDNTLNQIEYVMMNGNFFNNEDALKICDSLLDLSGHMNRMAKTGKKFRASEEPGLSNIPFEFYHNELVYTNNTILLVSDLTKVVFSTFDSPNVLISSDPRIFAHAENWFHNIKSKSDYMTEVSEKNRNLFFSKLEKKVSNTRRRLETFLDEI